jgi:hypothetical protein
LTLTTALYLTDSFTSVDNILGVICVMSALVTLFSIIYYINSKTEGEDDDAKLWGKYALNAFIIFIAFGLISSLIPSKKTMYLMMGAHYLQDSNIPKKVSQALELRLDKYIDELKDKKADK